MKKDIILFILSNLIIFGDQLFTRSEEGSKIDYCVEYVYAPSMSYLNLFDQLLCIECQLGYVVSKNYKQCNQFIYQLSYPQYGNCKRIAQDGSCAEALNGIHLLPNNQYTIVKDQKFLERCAIVNESETQCLFPRFGYILDLINKQIYKDTHRTFCALLNSQEMQCKIYHQGFIQDPFTNQGFYLGENFVNPHKFLNKNMLLICENNYFHLNDDFNQLIGCFPVDRLYQSCIKKCQKGYALRDDFGKCQIVIPYCQKYQEIQGKELCIMCQPFYRLYLQKCIKMIGCTLLSRKDPNKCLSCNSQNILKEGQCILKNSTSHFNQNSNDTNFIFLNPIITGNLDSSDYVSKEALVKQQDNNPFKSRINTFELGSISKRSSEEQSPISQTQTYDLCISDDKNQCLQCKDQIHYYLDEKTNQCIKRFRSLFCLNQSYNSDDCLNLFCQDNRFLNPKIIPNFDLKNRETTKFLVYIQNLFFDSDHIMTDYEKEQFHKKYQFYGVNLNISDQICVDYSEKLNQNETIFYFVNYKLQHCQEGGQINIQSKSELDYLYFDCPQVIQKKNITLEYCIEKTRDSNFCLRCENAYYFNSKAQICEKSIENCIVHSLNNTCLLCQSGYQLFNETSCDPICGNTITRNLFYFNSLYVNKTNDSNQTTCIKSYNSCKIFINLKCQECFEGYVLDQKQNYCLQDNNFPDCKIIDQIEQENSDSYFYDNKQCIKCQYEYVLFKGICFCQTQKCLSYIYCDEKKCIKTFRSLFIGQLNLGDNQYLEKKGDYYRALDCMIENCYQCHEGNICLQCKSGFQLENDQRTCLLIKDKVNKVGQQEAKNLDSSCLIFSKDGLNCMQCKQNYFLYQDLRCYEQCHGDQQVIFHKILGNICYECPFGCSKCIFDQNKLKNKEQMACESCFQGYFFYEEIQKCKKICVYYQSNKICTNRCPNNQFLLEKSCVDRCPYYYKIEGTQKICIGQCEGLYRYEDDPQKCSSFCEQEYIQDQKDLFCKKCEIKNCKICSKKQKNICIFCEDGYLSQNGQCLYQCLNKLSFSDPIQCSNTNILYCLKEEEQTCVQCVANSTYIKENNECICNDQYVFDLTLNACVKTCNENCQICDTQKRWCLRCKPNKYLNNRRYSNNSCVDTCPIGSFSTLRYNDPNFKECALCPLNCYSCENSQSCTECNQNYKEFFCNGLLFCVCHDDDIFCETNFKLKNQIKNFCPIQNCSLCSKNKEICEKCHEDYPYLYLNACFKSCPIGTYSDQNNQCQKCHPLCNSCTSYSSKSCLSCSLSNQIVESDNSCRCSNKNFFFQNECYSVCPRFTKPSDEIDRVCGKYCLDYNSYPVFNNEGQFEKCESNFHQSDSKFCEQNLINLNKYLTFDILETKLEEKRSQTILLTIMISQQPRECFDFQLKFKPSPQDEDSLNLEFKDFKVQSYFKFQFRMQSQIDVEQLKQKDQNNCRYSLCILYFQIYHKSQIKQTFKLSVNLKSDIVNILSINFPFLNQILKFDFDEDKLQKENYLDSFITVKCMNNNECNNQLVTSNKLQPIELSIKILHQSNNHNMERLVLIPIQIKIITEDNQTEQISDYFYNNDQNCQIKVEINFQKEIKGTLSMVFKALDSKKELFNFEQFANRNQIYLIKQSIQVKIEKQIDTDQKNTDSKNLIYLKLFIFNLIICIILVAFAIVVFLKNMKKQNQKAQQYQINDQFKSSEKKINSVFVSELEYQIQEQDFGDQN